MIVWFVMGSSSSEIRHIFAALAFAVVASAQQTTDAPAVARITPVSLGNPVSASPNSLKPVIWAITPETSSEGKIGVPCDLRSAPGAPVDAVSQQVLITVTCAVDVPNLVLQTVALDGIQLLNPPSPARLTAVKGVEIRVPITVRINPQGKREFYVAATIHLTNGETESVVDRYLVHTSLAARPSSAKTPGKTHSPPSSQPR